MIQSSPALRGTSPLRSAEVAAVPPSMHRQRRLIQQLQLRSFSASHQTHQLHSLLTTASCPLLTVIVNYIHSVLFSLYRSMLYTFAKTCTNSVQNQSCFLISSRPLPIYSFFTCSSLLFLSFSFCNNIEAAETDRM